MLRWPIYWRSCWSSPPPCSDLEPPENRVCFSMSDSISFDSSPSSEINTTTALRWSIHKPAARFINSSLLDEFSQREIIDAQMHRLFSLKVSISSRHFKLKRLRSDSQNGTGGSAHHFFGYTAQEHMGQAASPVRADHDKIGLDEFCLMHNGRCCLTFVGGFFPVDFV